MHDVAIHYVSTATHQVILFVDTFYTSSVARDWGYYTARHQQCYRNDTAPGARGEIMGALCGRRVCFLTVSQVLRLYKRS